MRRTIFIFIFIYCNCVEAQIINWDGGGDGVSWDDSLNWDGDQIPNNNNRVIIGAGNVLVIPSGYTAVANQLENDGTLTINSTATLSLISGSSNQITNTKALINNGEIQLANTKTTFAALVNSGSSATFFNNGTITATSNINYSGIDNSLDATFNNNINGIINISNTTNSGIFNTSGLFNNIGNLNLSIIGSNAIYNFADFDNSGIISIDNTGGSGIYGQTTSDFYNDGTITITTNIGSYGIYSLGPFINNTGSSLTIQNTGNDGFRMQGGDSENDGIINVNVEIDGRGLAVFNGQFNNLQNGVINIDDTEDDGLSISASPVSNDGIINIGATLGVTGFGITSNNVFTNQNNGLININNTTDDGFYSNSTLAKVTNYGTISMNTSIGDYGINNTREFDNYGILNISDTADDGIINNYKFNNYSGAMINIGSCGQDGIYNTGSDTFSNAGAIVINGSVGFNGIYNYSSGTFINQTVGQIEISNTGLDGIYNYLNSDFHNDGNIDIKLGIGRHGFYNRQFTTFNQASTGSINVSHATLTAFLNESSAEIHNEGTYTDPNGYGFVNKAPIKPGSSPGTISITSNLDFTNSQSMYYVEVQNENLSDVIHVTGNVNLGGRITVDLLGQYMPTSMDTIVVMTYSGSLSGSFTTVDLPSPSMDCFEVNYDTHGEIKLQKSVNEWTGGSASWFFPSRWDEGRVPLACDDVLIPNSSDIPAITSNGVAQSVTNYGTLNITSTGDLTLDGSSKNGVSNYGTINNEGNLNIHNTVDDGLFQVGSAAEFYNEGNVFINVNIGRYGIRMINNSFFENLGTGILDINNTDDHGAFLGAGCTLLQQPGASTKIDKQ